MKRIKRHKGTEEEWEDYIVNENKAYEELIKKGYSPQGCSKDLKNIIVFKIENQYTNEEKKECYNFENYQTANENLK